MVPSEFLLQAQRNDDSVSRGVDNATDSSDKDQTSILLSKKRKYPAYQKRSIGHNYKLRRQKMFYRKGSRSGLESVDNVLTDMEALDILTMQKNCCAAGGESGCILRHFKRSNTTIYLDGAVIFVKDCRRQMSTKSPEEKDSFMYDKFIESLAIGESKQTAQNKDKRRRLNHRFQMTKEWNVCTKCFLDAHGLTVHGLNKISQLYKQLNGKDAMDTKAKVLLNLNHKAWTDDIVLDFTVAETKEIFRENLRNEVPGTFILDYAYYIVCLRLFSCRC
jgi:hypothetical protein